MTYPDGRHAEQPSPHFERPHLDIPHQRQSTGWLGQPDPADPRTPAQPEQRFVAPPGRQQYGAGPGSQHAAWSPPPPPANWEQPRPSAWAQPRPVNWEQPTGGQPFWAAPNQPTEPPPVARPEAPRTPEQDLPALLRGRVVDRLISVNASHAGHAADNVRTKDDLCEHAIALFSADPTDQSITISTATRLSLSDSDNANLADVLTSLTRVVEQKLAEAGEQGRPWDPRTPLTGLVNRSEDLRRSMVYVGVGVSTLDTPEQPWRQMKNSVDRRDGLQLRGQGYLYLADGTTVHFVRAAQLGNQTGQHQITTNRMLHSQYQYKRNGDMLAYANQRIFLVWEQLSRLHQLLTTATHQ
jgi:hypothetical protein